MSEELKNIVPLLKYSSIFALYAAQARHSDENLYGSPEAWKARLPHMVEHAIPSEVLDLIEALNTTDYAIPKQDAERLLIATYENGARSSLSYIPFWAQQQNQRMVEASRKSAEADRLRAEALRTGSVTIQQALDARKIERSTNNPAHPNNPYLNFQNKPVFKK